VTRPASRFAALAALRKSRDLRKLIAMMALSFLVIFVVGVLRPIRDAIALAGLKPGQFYQVYFVSAVVVLFVPLYNRLAERIRWKELIPGVALFFAASMVAFRMLYLPGSAIFGMAFYGWYDLMVAALVTQFFMATQLFYNARDAKRAYPLVIAAGSVGAAVGGGITAFFSQRLGTANLLLVAGAAIVMFAVGISLVWRREDPDAGRPREPSVDDERSPGDLRRIFSNRQVQLIAVTVLLTVLVKQFVDYEYKTLTREVFQDLDRMSGFLGTVDAATQWLPIVVLLSLRPILKRWGAGVTVMIFPVAMIFATGALATILTLPVAVMARTSERMFRYSAERTGRELLYVPVPDEIKLKAKAYIDVAVEKGLGKVLSGAVIFVLVLLTGSMSITNRLVLIGFVGIGAAILLLLAFLQVRRQYVHSLAASFEGRFASLGGTSVSLLGPAARQMVAEALTDSDPLKPTFALDLIGEGDEEDVARFGDELHGLLGHESPDLRARALDVLAGAPDAVDPQRVRDCLRDPDAHVRERAVHTLAVSAHQSSEQFFEELLRGDDPAVRSATLACLADDVPADVAERIVAPFFDRLRASASEEDPTGRLELAAAAGLVPHADGVEAVVRRYIADADPYVGAAAVLSAARLEAPELTADVIAALGIPHLRHAARVALTARGEDVLVPLVAALDSQETDPVVRRNVPGALGDIPSQATVDALLHSYMLTDTEQDLDNRALGALSRLRAREDGVDFPRGRVLEVVDREIDAAARHLEVLAGGERLVETRAGRMLVRALRDARAERRENLFRLLGLIYPQRGMYRSYLAIESGEDRPHANAMEWLESTVGHAMFTKLRPALQPEEDFVIHMPRTLDLLRRLWDDEDVWLARCALWAYFEADPEGMRGQLDAFQRSDPGLGRSVSRLRARMDGLTGRDQGTDMDLIEKVFLLQNVDLLSGAPSRQLALLASIAREIDADADRVLLRRGEPTDALYVVIRGEVELDGVADQSITVPQGAPFGTWALIDDESSFVEARTKTPCRLLKIQRSDFHDLLVDHPELGLALLKGLARRIRSLAPV